MDEKSNEDLLKMVTAQYNRVFEEMRKVEDQLFRQILANTPSKIDEWIKCSERLPDVEENPEKDTGSKDVLIVDSDKTLYVARLSRHPIKDYIKQVTYSWEENSTGCGCCCGGLAPTHWMPLPNAPEGE
jgi:hypothetical protein